MKLSLPLTLIIIIIIPFFTLDHHHHHHFSLAQQIYSDNGGDNCGGHSSTSTLGYSCNGPQTSCSSYLTFRSRLPAYQTPQSIARLLNADPSSIAAANNSSATAKFPAGHEVIVPARCSCSGEFYQHNASYTIRAGDTYYLTANTTYQGLTTCQALIKQNPYKPENLPIGRDILVPLRCGCPTRNQISSGFRYLLTYVIIQGETITSIARRFGIAEQSLLDANPLWEGILYPYSTVLVPLISEPGSVGSPPPPPLASSPEVATFSSERESDNKMVFIGIGIAIGFLAPLALLLLWLMHQNRLRLPFRSSSIDEELSDTSLEASLSSIITMTNVGNVDESVTGEGNSKFPGAS